MEDVSFWVAFGAGVLSFFTPCILPLVPVYLATLIGADALEAAALEAAAKQRLLIFFHSLSFVAGFSLVFIALGGIAGLLGLVVSPYLPTLRVIAGVILVIFGVFMLLVAFIPQLNFEKRLNLKVSTRAGYVRSAVIGAFFCFAWTPCVGPILGSILTMALYSEQAGVGAALLAAYSAGLAIPLLVIGLAFNSLLPLMRRLVRYTTYLYTIGAIFLIGIGVLMLTNRLNFLQ